MTARQMVLIVDDEPDVCWALSTLLRQHGFATATVTSGAEALRWLTQPEQASQLILIDAKLGDIEGADLAKRIRAETCCISPMIMVSGYFYKDDSLVQEMLRTSLIAAFVTKPFRHDEILKAIHMALSAK